MSETVESIIARAFDPTPVANTDPADRWAEDWKQLRVIASFKAAQALAALDAAGYAVVPKEPTTRMQNDGHMACESELRMVLHVPFSAAVYRAMLAAHSGETPK